MTSSERIEVVVAGGGHAGLLLGTALAVAGFDVRIVERQNVGAVAAAAADGRNLALLAGSALIARRLEVWPSLAARAEPVQRVVVTAVEGGGRIHYDSAAHGGGPFGYGFEHVVLRRALLEAFLSRSGTDAWICDEVTALRRVGDGIAVRLASGRELTAALLVGADGRASRVRELARIGVDRWSYDQRALTMVIRHDRPHLGTVREWLRAGGPLATLPLRGQRSGITWTERAGDANELGALPGGDLLATLTRATGGVLGRVAIESGPSVFPLGAQHARAYVAPRIALVGDAAHGVHPIHAQGFNMGVADVGALVEALIVARQRGLALGSGEALLPYARARRPDNTQRLWLTDGLVRLFTADQAPLRAARSLALDLIERLPPLKRWAVRQGMQTG